MGKNSGIEWTDHTWNPWYGCHKVSQGCKNCYMYQEMAHYGRDPNVVVRSKTTFGEPLKWQRLADRLKKRMLVFTCSWSDFFIEEADGMRAAAWDIMRNCPDLTFQVLTKRPERIEANLPADWGEGYENVWLGVSAEDQVQADKRLPLLLNVPARVRFVSCEPLLGWTNIYASLLTGGLHWVIGGGESGPHARVMEVGWIRELRDECVEVGVPFFFKQWGQWAADYPQGVNMANREMTSVNGHTYYRVGRKLSGAMLDGREWRQMPAGWVVNSSS